MKRLKRVDRFSGLAVVIALLLSVPILVIVSQVFSGSAALWQHLAQTVLPDYLKNSFYLSIGVSAGVLVIGVSTAWLTSQYHFLGSRLLNLLLMLPMAIPAYIIAYSYTGLLDFSGPVQQWIRTSFDLRYGDYWFPQIRSLGGAIWMLIFVLYPYVFLLARAAFLSQSSSLAAASRSLGNSGWSTFWRINLPLARPAIVAGVSLVLMETLADYGTMQYFGIPTFTTGIFRTYYGLGNLAAAAQLASLLLSAIALLIWLEKYSRRKQQYFNNTEAAAQPAKISLSPLAGALAFSWCLLPVLFGFVIPVCLLLVWCLQYVEQFTASFFILAWNSLMLAAVAALIATAIALLLAYAERFNRSRLTQASVQVASLGYALPGTIIAIGVLTSFAWLDHQLVPLLSGLFSKDLGLLFSGTLMALLFAYCVRFMAMPLGAARSALAQIKPSIDQSAKTLGKNTAQTLYQIHMPLLKGSLLTAFLMVFVDVLKELPATLILRPFNFNTLAVRAYELASDERLYEAAPAALTIVLVGLIPVYLLTKSIYRER
ncbi:ABC transporter permease [Reinekea thalattae]|uniref:Iron ABC transporter permease n=1 Tax=Reinekea thalattae TaxID=2593301 RepID=A0A5C8Z8M2_9GAMM|nr:iron ABC transporter permease [Reinekea thalattae]TXR53618.1 iron ABC transporter permease [Reinekea thalattae]